MAKKLELKVGWKTNEYYELDDVTLLIPDDKEEAIIKSQEFLKANPDVDTVRVRIDKDCLASMSDSSRLGYGFVIVSSGTGLYFIGTDNFDSKNQVETEEFFLSDVPMSEPRCKCSQCGGTNVQSKAWVKPNENDKFVDYISDEIEDSYCDDCDKHVNLDN